MISVFGANVGIEEILEIADSINSRWLGMGHKVEQFENEFAHRLGLDNFLLVDSGSNALYMAVVLLGLPKGSEIILPAITWVSCAHAVIMAGHKPIFCDVDLDTLNVTSETILPHISPNTGAIMVVHYGGKPVDMDPIMDLKYPVIEDAAHAVDSYYKGHVCGSIGDIGIYSFDAIKNLTTGEGGGITVKDEIKFERARKMRYCGIGKSGFQASQSVDKKYTRWWEYDVSDIFIKMLPSDMAASIGLAQLRKLDKLQSYRKAIWKKYQERFGPIEYIITPPEPGNYEKHSYFTYFIRVPERDRLARYLLDNNIYTTLRYHPLHLNPVYRSNVRLTNAEELNETGLNIPLHPNLTEGDVELIIDKILAFYKQERLFSL